MKKTSLIFAVYALFSVSHTAAEVEKEWENTIFIPTHITKHFHNYVMVNCWQHRIIYSHDVNADIADWKTLDSEIAGPHSVASYKNYLVAEDTGRDALILYRFENSRYSRVQRLEGLPRRPHRVYWEPEGEHIWMITSNNQMLYKIAFEPDNAAPLSVERTWDLPFLHGKYTRSFSVIDGKLYFVSGPSCITETSFPVNNEDAIEVIRTYKTPGILGGDNAMNDVFRTSDGWWYLSSTLGEALIRAKSLSALEAGQIEDVKATIGLKGTAYYLPEFDNRIWLTSIYKEDGIFSFRHDDDGAIVDIQTHFLRGPMTETDILRKKELPR